jgi:hypothetical protein
VRRCRRGTPEFEHKPVKITPIPVLARLVPPYNRVPGQAEVRGRGLLGLVVDEQERRVLRSEEMVGDRPRTGALVMERHLLVAGVGCVRI